MWLARNSQFRALALRAIGRLEEAIAAFELALITYRTAFLDVETAVIEPDEAIDLIAQIVEAIGNVDANGQKRSVRSHFHRQSLPGDCRCPSRRARSSWRCRGSIRFTERSMACVTHSGRSSGSKH
jgi:hypothetical protein